MSETPAAQSRYEIRRGGIVLCNSSMSNLDYSREALLGMCRAGLALYRDGKRVKLSEIK